MILAAGCKDADAQQRQEVHAAIMAASEKIEMIRPVRAGDEDAARARQELTRAISELNAASGGDPGQQAAASFLIAQARRQLAVGSIAEAQRVESDHRIRRQVADGMVVVAGRLEALADNLESMDISEELSQLDGARRDAEDQLRTASQQVAALDGPIAGLRSRNSTDAAEVARLRSDANDLRRISTDRGAAAGIAAYEEAVAKERQADLLEYEIAQRELELSYEMEPQHALAGRRVAHLQDQIQSIDDARRSLEQMVQDARSEASDARAQFGQFRQEITAAIGQIEEESAGTLNELYEQAARELEQASAKVRSAQSHDRQGDFANAARLEQARVSAELGNLHVARARALTDHLALVGRVAQVSSLGRVSMANPRELSAVRDQAQEQALAAYGEARNALGQVKARGMQQELGKLVRNLERAEALLQGQEPAPEPPASSAGAGRRAPAAPATGGAGSPEEIADAFNRMADPATMMDGLADWVNYIYPNFDKPYQRDLYALMQDQVLVFGSLDRAMRSAFGQSFLDMPGAGGGAGGMQGMPQVASARLGDVTADGGSIVLANPDGSTETVEIFRVDGRWFMPLPAELNLTEQQAAMAIPMGRQMLDIFGAFPDRIASGEIATIDAFMAELGAAMQQMMGGGQ
jgi:predicted  nucleic acid-binding Zn-ribbon protein